MNFDVKKTTEEIINFIKDYYKQNNLKGAVIGISGGKDSAVVAALITKALGKKNVIGVTMPCHTIENAKTDAKLISDYYGFKLINFDLTSIFDTFKCNLKKIGEYDDKILNNSDINIKPRLRMATLYYLAAMYSQIYNGTYLVAGTSNKCELYVGYFTKGGDSVHDIAPIADLTVDEVIQVGEYLKVPKKVLYKTPSDDLSNLTDEEKLKVKYSQIAAYMENEDNVDEITREKIKSLHLSNMHKFNIPTYRK